MNPRRASALAALLAVCAATPSLAAQTPAGGGPTPGDTLRLTLTEARRRALTTNPAFLADATARAIARGELREARVYSHNPEAEFEAPGSASAGELGAYEARLAQDVEWAGQRGLRIDAAELGVARAERGVAEAARQTLAEVSIAFYQTLAAEERLRVVTELSALNERFMAAVRVQLSEGEISVMEANLAQIEVGRARARVLSARREAASARLALGRLVGVAPEVPIQVAPEVAPAPSPGSLDLESLIAAALEQRPDLAAAGAAVRQSEALSRLARRNAVPNLRVTAIAGREAAGSDPRVGVAVGLPLPLWDRNQGRLARRRAETERAAYALEAIRLRVRTDVQDAYRAYLSATRETAVLEEDVLTPADRTQEMLETAYRAGKLDLSALVLLRNQLLDAELAYWDAWLAQREALVRLRSATGELTIEDLNGNDR